jgi:hypothetical protein
MAVRKPDEGKTQRQKFIEAARKLGIDEESDEAFQKALGKIIKAHKAAPKKAARKPKA